MNLMKIYLDKGHSSFMDNFYNSVDLAKELLQKSICCTGTLRSDPTWNPTNVKDAKLKQGETKAQYCDDVVVGKWKVRR